MDERAWLTKSAEILTDIKAWRGAHPKATFVEIEDEVHRRMMELEAQVLQDAAQASASREWGKPSEQAAPACPTCAIPLEARGQHQRTLQGNGGQSVQLERSYGTCPKCGAGLFPLDEELGLLPGTLAPRQQEHLVHLASCMPFKQAARMLADLLGVQISTETARRLTERMGAHLEAAQTAEADLAVPPESTDQPAPERRVVSVDGAMISLVHQQWVEVRTLAIGQPHEQRSADGKPEIHIGQLSYFSRLADASTFTELADVEVRRRRVKEARGGSVSSRMGPTGVKRFPSGIGQTPYVSWIFRMPPNISASCSRPSRKRACLFLIGCSNGVYTSSNIEVLVRSCA